ncbi:MAG TPA: bifunctional nicotinamidase/pyrazinamidase [Balneolaceae bacterium]|nr:bifunctional nicotinamidase/pyrazinamidase [Balneolaceae bacterium]
MQALLIIDVQNDFCPGGSLEVPDGDQIVPVINKLSSQFDAVIQTRDWHPEGHSSFASSHDDKEPFETTEMPYGRQVLWPDHCVQNSQGAEFHPDLNTRNTQLIIRKGFRENIDSYSAFFANDHETSTGLSGYLRERNINKIFVAGLATDFCVKWSVMDGLDEGFEVTVIEDAVKGIDIEGSVAEAWNEMEAAGADRISSKDLI